MSSVVPSLRPIAKATASQVAARALSALASLGSFALAARALGLEGFGRYAFYLAAFAILDALVDFGTMGAAIRRAGEVPASGLAVTRKAAQVRLVLAAGGVAATAALAAAAREAEPAFYALASTYLFGHALAPLSVPLHLELAFGPIAASRVAGSVLALSLSACLSAAGASHPALFLGAVGAGSVASNAAAAFAARFRIRANARAVSGDPSPAGFVRESAVLGAGALLRQTYFHLDSFFLRAISGPASVARFNAALRLLSLACMVPGYACAAALPALAKASAGERGEIEARLGRSLALLAATGAPVAFFLAGPILQAIYGEGGWDSEPPLRILVAAGLFAFPGNLFVTSLVARGRAATLLWISGAALGLRAALDAVLVPLLDDRGAALAAAATEGFVLAAALVARRAGRASK